MAGWNGNSISCNALLMRWNIIITTRRNDMERRMRTGARHVIGSVSICIVGVGAGAGAGTGAGVARRARRLAQLRPFRWTGSRTQDSGSHACITWGLFFFGDLTMANKLVHLRCAVISTLPDGHQKNFTTLFTGASVAQCALWIFMAVDVSRSLRSTSLWKTLFCLGLNNEDFRLWTLD